MTCLYIVVVLVSGGGACGVHAYVCEVYIPVVSWVQRTLWDALVLT